MSSSTTKAMKIVRSMLAKHVNIDKDAQQVETPETLNEDQTKAFRILMLNANQHFMDFAKLAAETISQNPELVKYYMAQNREKAIDKIAAIFAESDELNEIPLELITQIMNLPAKSKLCILEASQILEESQ